MPTVETLSRSELAAYLQKLQELHELIVSGSTDTYETGREIHSLSMTYAPHSADVAGPLWLIWGSLTDWVELRPEERSDADAEMIRAAREWLDLPADDVTERKRYLDRWAFIERGYERPDADA